METKLPDAEAAAVEAALEAWTKGDGTRRLLSGDAALWTGSDEAGACACACIRDGPRCGAGQLGPSSDSGNSMPARASSMTRRLPSAR